MKGISQNSENLLEASRALGTAADTTNGTMNEVQSAVNQVVENSTEQSRNSESTSENMRIMGDHITETSTEVDTLNAHADSMQKSSKKTADTLAQLCSINEEVERIIGEVKEQTDRTNVSIQKINYRNGIYHFHCRRDEPVKPECFHRSGKSRRERKRIRRSGRPDQEAGRTVQPVRSRD
ncbi:MAG: hypothetical protein ACLR6I_11475 [Waltera sp.]